MKSYSSFVIPRCEKVIAMGLVQDLASFQNFRKFLKLSPKALTKECMISVTYVRASIEEKPKEHFSCIVSPAR